jgi:hypothetical protein
MSNNLVRIPGSPAPVWIMKIAAAPCQPIFFELYSRESEDLQEGLSDWFQKIK